MNIPIAIITTIICFVESNICDAELSGSQSSHPSHQSKSLRRKTSQDQLLLNSSIVEIKEIKSKIQSNPVQVLVRAHTHTHTYKCTYTTLIEEMLYINIIQRQTQKFIQGA